MPGTYDAALDALADFLSGRVAANEASIASGNLQRNYYFNGGSAFFQDTWKVSPRLTLNYGLNWVYESPLEDPTDRISTFIPADGGITYVGTHGLNTLWPQDFHDFVPVSALPINPRPGAS